MLSAVFRSAFDTASNRCAAAEDLGADNRNKGAPGFWRIQGARYKVRSITALACDIFQITCGVSYVAKQPLMHFLHWAQKRNKEFKEQQQHEDTVYGATPMSELVAFKAWEIQAELEALLADCNLVWCSVFRLAAGHDGKSQEGTRQLIVAAVLLVAAGWDYRVCEAMGSENQLELSGELS